MISVRNVVKYHGPLRILDGISVEFERAKVVAVVGPSGGGKSTLLRCINALEPFQEGEIRVGDIALSGAKSPPKETLLKLRRTVGMVFQQFHLFPHMTARQNVMSGPLFALNVEKDAANATAVKLLERVGLGEKLDAKPSQLSGGQQQRVAIARTLAVNPAAILFDEPTSALDPKMAAEVMTVIDDLANDEQFQATMVIVSHDVRAVTKVADAVVVLERGRAVYAGPADGAPAGYLE
jgi:ABC-type polar amino acid transport system ATPase subunit